MSFHMIVEQTKAYQKRIVYNSETNSFYESGYDSLAFIRNDGDHKFIAVERSREIDDIEALTGQEKDKQR